MGRARREAAPRLAAAVERHLKELAWPGPASRWPSPTTTRPATSVTFLLGANPGEAALPLAKVASGGELARTMLACRPGAERRPAHPRLRRGRRRRRRRGGRAVGRLAARRPGRRWPATAAGRPGRRPPGARRHPPAPGGGLRRPPGGGHQGRARRPDGGRRAAALDGAERVVELSRMLSGQPASATARDHAEELLATAVPRAGPLMARPDADRRPAPRRPTATPPGPARAPAAPGVGPGQRRRRRPGAGRPRPRATGVATGRARVDRRTKNLIPRLQPGEVAVIDHEDLDRVAAEGLIRAQAGGGGQRRPLDLRPLPQPRAPPAGRRRHPPGRRRRQRGDGPRSARASVLRGRRATRSGATATVVATGTRHSLESLEAQIEVAKQSIDDELQALRREHPRVPPPGAPPAHRLAGPARPRRSTSPAATSWSWCGAGPTPRPTSPPCGPTSGRSGPCMIGRRRRRRRPPRGRPPARHHHRRLRLGVHRRPPGRRRAGRARLSGAATPPGRPGSRSWAWPTPPSRPPAPARTWPCSWPTRSGPSSSWPSAPTPRWSSSSTRAGRGWRRRSSCG